MTLEIREHGRRLRFQISEVRFQMQSGKSESNLNSEISDLKSHGLGRMAVVGRIARAHGIRGQVIVNPETDFPEERFRPGAELFVARGGRDRALTLTSGRFHRERPVVGLIAGVDTMNDAEALAGLELRVPIERLARCRGHVLPARPGRLPSGDARRAQRWEWCETSKGTPAGSRLVVDGAAARC